LRIDFSLCAFTGTPYWRYRYRSIESGLLVFLDPRKKRAPAHEFPTPEGDGWNRRATAHMPGNGFTDMRFGAVEKLRNVSESEEVEIQQCGRHTSLASTQ